MSLRISDQGPPDRDVDAYDVADYVGDVALELAELARTVGMVGTAAALELARKATEAELRRLNDQPNAAPEDAA